MKDPGDFQGSPGNPHIHHYELSSTKYANEAEKNGHGPYRLIVSTAKGVNQQTHDGGPGTGTYEVG